MFVFLAWGVSILILISNGQRTLGTLPKIGDVCSLDVYEEILSPSPAGALRH